MDIAVPNHPNSPNSLNSSNSLNSPKHKYRIVISSPFTQRNTVSYGLLVYAKNTKRWAIVQRKHSVEFLLFMKGCYRLSHLSILLSSITPCEYASIRHCALSRDNFTEMYISQLFFDDNGLEYAYSQFVKNLSRSLNLLSQLDLSNNKLEWTWPKGRISYQTSETPISCAVREFEEEVGIKLPPPQFISDFCVADKFVTITNRTIESRFWIYVIETEITMPTLEFHPEVASRFWASTEQCQHLLPTFDFTNIIPLVQ